MPAVNGSASALPPALPRLDYAAFRRKLAGLSDPERRDITESEKVAVKHDAIRFVCVLAHLFGDSLDRLTLWGRIGTALETAGAKVSDDDLDRFADLCLEHVQADAGHAAACDALTTLRQAWEQRPSEWRYSLLAYYRTHKYAALTHGRARWDEYKAKRIEL